MQADFGRSFRSIRNPPPLSKETQIDAPPQGQVPVSARRVTVNKKTGKRTVRCLMENECLSCDGKCVGYRKTVKQMAPLRAAWRKMKAEMRRKTDHA